MCSYFWVAASFSTLNPHNRIHVSPLNGLTLADSERRQKEEKRFNNPFGTLPASPARKGIRAQLPLSNPLECSSPTKQQGTRGNTVLHVVGQGTLGFDGIPQRSIEFGIL